MPGLHNLTRLHFFAPSLTVTIYKTTCSSLLSYFQFFRMLYCLFPLCFCACFSFGLESFSVFTYLIATYLSNVSHTFYFLRKCFTYTQPHPTNRCFSFMLSCYPVYTSILACTILLQLSTYPFLHKV